MMSAPPRQGGKAGKDEGSRANEPRKFIEHIMQRGQIIGLLGGAALL
jgi:hypothetical protein